MAGLIDQIQGFKKRPQYTETEDNNIVKDSEWVLNTFMVKSASLSDTDKVNRYWSVTDLKFTDTSLGGNLSLNTYPQFTRYADIRSKGIVNDRTDVTINDLNGNLGMGRFYGEAIEDNSVHVYLTFGVPKFNNLFNFLFSSVDYKKATIVSKGRDPFLYNFGFALGSAAILVAFPIIVPFLWLAKTAYKFLLAPGRLDYYYMKPTMPSYWSGVNSIVTMMSTELGILAPIFDSDNKKPDLVGTPVKFDNDDLKFMSKYMPDLITDNNFIDVPAIALKAQRAANSRFMKQMELYESGQLSESNFVGLIKGEKMESYKLPESGLTSKLNKMMMLASKVYGKKEETNSNYESNISGTTGQNFDSEEFSFESNGQADLPNREEDEPSYLDELKAYIDSELREGASYAVFKVDAPGSITESFNNSVGDIGVEGTLKSVSKKVKDIRFNFSDANVVPGMSSLVGGISEVISGTLDGITMGASNVISYLLGDANPEMVKKWEDSSASFPEINFKMKLVCPYNNPISQLKNLYIPLAAILNGALPRSTGGSSYGSPYLCSMFVRGQQSINLGMITSLTITRGTSNLPFSKQRRPLAIDVSFTVTDFSKIMSVPTQSSILDPANVMYTDTAPLNRYIASLCARDLNTTVHMGPKLKLKISRFIGEVDHVLSPAYWGMKIGNITPDFVQGVVSSKNVYIKESY